jgi:N-methylhydantoinase A
MFVGEAVPTAVYRGEEVPAGAGLAGPAILEFPGTTVVVGPSQDAAIDPEGNITITARTPLPLGEGWGEGAPSV